MPTIREPINNKTGNLFQSLPDIRIVVVFQVVVISTANRGLGTSVMLSINAQSPGVDIKRLLPASGS